LPVFPWGAALVLRWLFQYLLLAGFAACVALAPQRTLDWVAEAESVPGPTGVGGVNVPNAAAISLKAR